MNELIDISLPPALRLVDWSLRWGLIIVLLGVGLAMFSPRRVATRLLLCRLVLVGGLATPWLPHYWGPIASSVPISPLAAHSPPKSADRMVVPSETPLAPTPARVLPVAQEPMAFPAASDREHNTPPSETTATPIGRERALALAMELLWFAGVVLLMGRLILGWARLIRLRRSASLVGPTALELLERCREELVLHRHVDLRTHPAVHAPILVGGVRPAILVPPNWDALPAEHRRAALLHELTHLAHWDDWARAGEETVRAFFFFHPLVRWLLNRLDGEREQLCDVAVVQHGMAPRQLARVLLDFAKQLGAGRSPVAVGTALPFLSRITVKDRIDQLLEDDMTRWITPLSRGRRVALAAAVLGLMVALGGFTIQASAPEDKPTLAVEESKEQTKPAEVRDTIQDKLVAAALAGRVVDMRGRPVPQAEIIGLCRAGTCTRLGGPKVTTDAEGRFRIDHGPQGAFLLGDATAFQVRVPGGNVFEVSIIAAKDQVELRLPTISGTEIKGPQDVQPDELAGVVVDEKGQPLAGVHVHVWDWVDRPENQAHTGKDGVFRIRDCGRNQKVEVRFRKAGYSPVLFVQQPTGVKDFVVAMDSKTYFEGVVRGPDGKPAANALIRADQGPKGGEGGIITSIWTDTRTDASGHYRLYVEPDAYAFLVKAPGVGVAHLPKTPIAHGQARPFHIQLEPGITFRAVTVDATTGQPVAGVRLWHWQHKDVEGRSDSKGEVAIPQMLPGRFEFSVEAAGYTRWWSEESLSEWSRRQLSMRPGSKWQRNFDYLDFDVKPNGTPVKIVLEKGVRITGRVLDPDGKPVDGATVAPALTGTGNSVTGDTRFSVPTKPDGTFEMLLPASGKAEYNLVAHDGKYHEWRKWANGVLPPIQTTPGMEIEDVILTLTQPATVRGKVVDAQGKPVADREVRAHAADKLENRYYDPTTTTKGDGTFELRLIRPGEHFIQAAPFWLTAEEAPGNSTRRIRLTAGETVEAVELVGAEPRP